MCNKCCNCENYKEKVGCNRNMTEVRPLTWQQAVDWAVELGEDWVLPDRFQLFLMYQAKELGHPDLQDMKDCFWSSDGVAADGSSAWFVGFYNGYVGNNVKTYPYCVRCVRREFLNSLILWVLKNERETK